MLPCARPVAITAALSADTRARERTGESCSLSSVGVRPRRQRFHQGASPVAVGGLQQYPIRQFFTGPKSNRRIGPRQASLAVVPSFSLTGHATAAAAATPPSLLLLPHVAVRGVDSLAAMRQLTEARPHHQHAALHCGTEAEFWARWPMQLAVPIKDLTKDASFATNLYYNTSLANMTGG